MIELERPGARPEPCQVPQVIDDGFVKVDSTWGEVQPIVLAPGVRTIGELELIEHVKRGLPLIDTRLEEFHRQGTIPSARGISHEQMRPHRHELDPAVPTVFFCNGPQCTATPDAIHALLQDGYPPDAILYYRGGMHDWVTLGYPTSTPDR